MSRITTEIQRINRAKSALREAINAKGGTLSETAKIDEYPDVVRRLPSGGQTMTPIKLKDGNNFLGWSLMTELPPIDTSELTSAYRLMYGCTSLESLTLDLPECTNASQLVEGCTKLRNLALTLPKCINARELAYGCINLESLTLDLPECTNASQLVKFCTKLRDINITRLKTSLDLVGTAVTIESVQYIVEHAQEAMDGAILTLPKALESKLPDETMEMAIEKGFEVAFR